MASGNVPPQRLSEETATVFTALMLFGGMMSDEKYEEIRRLKYSLIEKKSKGFSAATLLFELCKGTS